MIIIKDRPKQKPKQINGAIVYGQETSTGKKNRSLQEQKWKKNSKN